MVDITLNITQCIRACFSCCFLSLELESQCHSYILAEICCISWNRQVLIEEGEGKAKDLGWCTSWNEDTLISEAGRHGWCELEVRQWKFIPVSCSGWGIELLVVVCDTYCSWSLRPWASEHVITCWLLLGLLRLYARWRSEDDGGACEGSETSRAALMEGVTPPPRRRVREIHHGTVPSFMAARRVIHYVKKNWLYNI